MYVQVVCEPQTLNALSSIKGMVNKHVFSTATKDLFGRIICQNVLCCFYRILERDV